LEHKHGQVNAVAFSPDGKTALTGSFDGAARLWEVARNVPGMRLACARNVTGSTDNEDYVASFRPGGNIALKGVGKTARLLQTARPWDADLGQPIGPSFEHQETIRRVAISPDGSIVATTGGRTTRLWHAGTGKPFSPPLEHQNARYAEIAFSLDGKTILTITSGKAGSDTAQLWEVATGKPLGRFLKERHWEAFSPDGKTLLKGVGDTARLYEAATGNPIGHPLQHQGLVRAVAFSPDGKTVLTGGGDGEKDEARLWDVATGKPIGAPLHPRGSVSVVAFSPDGKTVLTGGTTAQLWEAATSKPLGPPFQGGGTFVGFGSDGKTVLMASDLFTEDDACLWDVIPVSGDLGRIALWVQVSTRLELDEGGAVRELDDETWQHRLRRLQELGGPPDPFALAP
jgi:WD40 repeat protein